MNEHITSYLDKYLALQKPDFAVMITGEWGCGKTFFIKTYKNTVNNPLKETHIFSLDRLFSFFKKQKNAINKPPQKICYLSLNGTSSLNDIIPQLIIELSDGKLNDKHLKYLTLGKAIFSGVFKYLNINDSIKITDISGFSPANITIVFDDIERSKIDISVLLGELSLLVEQQNLHIILIGDEAKILAPEYQGQKEKIIGKTLEFESSDTEILPILITAIESKCIPELAKNHIDEICNLIRIVNSYKAESRTNYRIVKHVLQEFAFVFEPILTDCRIKDHLPSVFMDLFSRFYIVSYGLQSAKIKYPSLLNTIAFNGYFSTESPEHQEHFSFINKFPVWENDYFIPLEAWRDIFQNKKIQADSLIICIEQRFNPKKENWRELWYYFEKTDKEINDCLAKINDDIKQEKYKDPVVIIHVFATLLDMSREEFFEKSPADIVTEAKNYIAEIARGIHYNEQVYQLKNLLQYNGSGLGIHGAETTEVKEIADEIMAVLSQKDHEVKTNLYKKLLSKFSDDISDFEEWAHSGQRYKDIFSDQDPQLFWDAWIILRPKAFREIGHWFDSMIIEAHLLNHRKVGAVFWAALVDLAKTYLEKHKQDKDEKNKCLYLERFFIPNVENLLSPADTNKDESISAK